MPPLQRPAMPRPPHPPEEKLRWQGEEVRNIAQWRYVQYTTAHSLKSRKPDHLSWNHWMVAQLIGIDTSGVFYERDYWPEVERILGTIPEVSDE